MFPNVGYTVKSVRVKWFTELPKRPSSRWRYQMYVFTDYMRLRDGFVKHLHTYAYTLRKSMNPSNMQEMFNECIEQGMNRARAEMGDDSDEPWEYGVMRGGTWHPSRVRKKEMIVLRQYKTDRGPKTLKPIETYRKRKR